MIRDWCLVMFSVLSLLISSCVYHRPVRRSVIPPPRVVVPAEPAVILRTPDLWRRGHNVKPLPRLQYPPKPQYPPPRTVFV